MGLIFDTPFVITAEREAKRRELGQCAKTQKYPLLALPILVTG